MTGQAEALTEEARKATAQAGQAAEDLTAGVRDATDQATDQAGTGANESVRSAGRQLGSAAGQLREQTRSAVAAAGQQLDQLGAPDAVRQPAQATMDAVSGAADRVAGGLERGGAYLEEQGATGLVEDLKGVARRHPGPMLGVVAVVLLLLVLALVRRRA